MQLSRIFLDRDSLASNITRNFLGERTFDSLSTEFLPASNQPNAIITFLFNGSKKLLGFLANAAIGFLEWTAGGILRYIIEKAIELPYFDFAQSDVELGKEIEQNNALMFQQLGRFIGSGTVWLVSIGTASLAAVNFPVVAGRIALDLASEGGQALRSQLEGSLALCGELLFESCIMGLYAGTRWLLRKIFPDQPAFQGNEGRKPWLIAEKVEEKMNQIPGGSYVKGFFEGLLDGTLDALLDVGYVISFSLDDHYAANRAAESNNTQPIRTVEVFPNSQSEESVIIEDTQENIEVEIQNYLTQHSLVNNRDIGTVVGQTYDEWYSLKPQSRRLVIEFRGKELPPYIDTDGKPSKRVQIAIPNAKAGISWNDLKSIRHYTWGQYLARGVFEDRRQISVWGSSESEAKNTLTQMAKFCLTPLIQISISHPEVQNRARKKTPTVVYPAYATMLVRKPTVGANDYTLIDGQNSAMARQRIEIWKSEPPQNFTGF